MLKKYSVMVEGKNIHLNRGQMGFFTTRRVEAISKREAEEIAIELIKQELETLGVLCNSIGDPPTFVIEKVDEVDSFGDFVTPGKGFTLFPEGH
ncbi:MAG TPA: hypothetical protein VK138_09095 [Acidiferrobacterales bacterium]|nr:hypothetical protein [Acidiferrobacterales bacterium]